MAYYRKLLPQAAAAIGMALGDVSVLASRKKQTNVRVLR